MVSLDICGLLWVFGGGIVIRVEFVWGSCVFRGFNLISKGIHGFLFNLTRIFLDPGVL